MECFICFKEKGKCTSGLKITKKCFPGNSSRLPAEFTIINMEFLDFEIKLVCFDTQQL